MTYNKDPTFVESKAMLTLFLGLSWYPVVLHFVGIYEFTKQLAVTRVFTINTININFAFASPVKDGYVDYEKD